MTEKLDNEHATDQIKQTRHKREIIFFRDSAIEKISIKNLNFGSKRFKQFKFDISKGSSLKGLLLRFVWTLLIHIKMKEAYGLRTQLKQNKMRKD